MNTLDDYIENLQINPFKTRDPGVYLTDLAKYLNIQIEWTNSIYDKVMQLKPHKCRLKPNKKFIYLGWFDQYTSPNIIFLHTDCTLDTIIHEMRHALHLGNHNLLNGNVIDQEIQKYTTYVNTLENPSVYYIRYAEYASEIIAYTHDYSLALRFRCENELYHIVRNLKIYQKLFSRVYIILRRRGSHKDISSLYHTIHNFINGHPVYSVLRRTHLDIQ